MSIELTWLGHASFRLAGGPVVYIDPWKIDGAPGDGDLVIVSHSHSDHCSDGDVARVIKADGEVLAPADTVDQLGRGTVAGPGQAYTPAGVTVHAVWAYNVNKAYHPRSKGWLGAVVEIGGARVYYAGDTDLIPEMGELGAVDAALLPVGGTYTMTAAEAAEACRRIAPAVAIPYHWGDIVGTRADADAFADAAGCEVRVLAPGDTITIG